jgi:hypothetical protein
MPAIQIISAVGLVGALEKIKLKKIFIGTIFAAAIFSFSSYLHSYYTTYAIESALDFQYGYKQALTIARQRGKTREKIVVTDKYGQPYIYVLLHNRIKPEQFLAGALANYEFHTFDWPYYKPNSVIVGTPEEIPPEDFAVQEVVKIPNTDEIVFVIAETPKE